jgi:indolepyruvate ferredoxin oxidoreductase
MMAKIDPISGEPRKRAFGPWMEKGFAMLMRMKSLRGTALDPFGRTPERREERAMIGDMEEACRLVAKSLSPATDADAHALLGLAQEVKGYGHIKARNLAAVKPRWDGLIANLSTHA